LALLGNDLVDRRFALLALVFLLRQEYNSRAEFPGRWQVGTKFFLGNFRQELVRQCSEHTGSVARIRLATARAAMIHRAQDFIRVQNDLVAAFTLDVGDETHTATIFLIRRVVQALLLWIS